MLKDDADARRQRMRSAAAEILIAEGPRAITHRRIAAAAAIPTGSANYLFPTRKELYAAAVEAAEELRGISAATLAAEIPLRRRTDQHVARLLLEIWYAPRLEGNVAHVRVEPILTATGDPELQRLMAASRPRLLDCLQTVLARSRRTPCPDVDLLAQVLDGALLYGAGTGEDPISTATNTVARFLALTAPVAQKNV